MVNIQSPNKILIADKNRNKKITIFMDLDGVLSNWLQAACDVCDIDLDDDRIRKDIKDNDGQLDNYVEEGNLWDNIENAGVDFWSKMELFSWSKKLYKEVEKVADEFAILSSPGKFPAVAAPACHGKALWLEEHFNNKEQYLFGYKKFLCANKDTILIDDSQRKIEPFKEAGGYGFLWPNPLALIDGDVDVDKTIDDLVDYIKELKNG